MTVDGGGMGALKVIEEFIIKPYLIADSTTKIVVGAIVAIMIFSGFKKRRKR